MTRALSNETKASLVKDKHANSNSEMTVGKLYYKTFVNPNATDFIMGDEAYEAGYISANEPTEQDSISHTGCGNDGGSLLKRRRTMIQNINSSVNVIGFGGSGLWGLFSSLLENPDRVLYGDRSAYRYIE